MSDEEGNASLDSGEGTDTPEGQVIDEGKTFNQAEVDKLISERLSRQSKKYSDYDELRTFKAQAEANKLASLSENEQAIELARTESANAVKNDYATQLAAANIKAELTGLVENTDAIIEDLNLSKFVNDDYTVNTEAVSALRLKYEKLLGGKKKSTPANIGHGRTNNGVKTGNAADDFAEFIQQFN